jgi:predicted DNA-binding protein YlxM (UPF0122 family)
MNGVGFTDRYLYLTALLFLAKISDVAVKCFALTRGVHAMQDEMLDKTIRINMLFDFYQSLLTDKQQTFLRCYYHDDFSLGEIASEFDISRQAVFEHIKRAEHMLEEYEQKLQLLARHIEHRELVERLQAEINEIPETYRESMTQLVEQLRHLE